MIFNKIKSDKKEDSFCFSVVVFSIIVFFTLYRFEFNNIDLQSILYLISCVILAVIASLFSYKSINTTENKSDIIILFTLFISEINFLFSGINLVEFRTPLSFALFYIILIMALKESGMAIVFLAMLFMVILNPISVYMIPVIVFYYIYHMNKKAVAFAVFSSLLFFAVFAVNIFGESTGIYSVWFQEAPQLFSFDSNNVLNHLFFVATAIPFLVFIFYFYFILYKSDKKNKFLFIFNGIITLLLLTVNIQIIPIIIGCQILLMIIIYNKSSKPSDSLFFTYFSFIKSHIYLIFLACLIYSASRCLIFQSSFNQIGSAIARFFAVNP